MPPLLELITGNHLMRTKSAAGLGKSRRIPFEAELGRNYFDLLNHPLVYAKLRDRLSQSAARAVGTGDARRDIGGDG